jgi:hypothetical protein
MRYIFLVIAIIVPGYCFAQLHASFSTGLAGFGMREMKDHQMELKVQFPTDVKIIESFPAFWFYEFSLTGEITDRVRIGGAVGFTSTGGRMAYRDYSGRIECDQMTTAWTAAIRGEVLLNPGKNWPIYFTTRAGYAFGRYDLDVFVEVGDDDDATSIRFQSMNLFVEPGILASKNIVGPLSATLNAGYSVNVLKGEQKLTTNTNLFLLDNSGDKVRLDWSGFRLSAGLSVSF